MEKLFNVFEIRSFAPEEWGTPDPRATLLKSNLTLEEAERIAAENRACSNSWYDYEVVPNGVETEYQFWSYRMKLALEKAREGLRKLKELG